MARQRPRSNRRSSGGQSQGGNASPGMARAMKGLRGFAYQAVAGFEKLQEAAKALIPVIQQVANAMWRQRQMLIDTLPVLNQMAAGFRRLTGAMVATGMAVQVLTSQYAGLGSTMLRVGTASLQAMGSLTAVRTAASAAMMATSSGMAAATASTWSFAAAATAAAVPFALLAAAVGLVYVAAFKWQEMPGWLKAILFMMSPLVQVVRTLALVFNTVSGAAKLTWAVLTAPLTVPIKSVGMLVGAFTALGSVAVSAVKSLGSSLVSLGSKLGGLVKSAAGFAAGIVGGLKGVADRVTGFVSGIGSMGERVAGFANRVVGPLTEAGKQFGIAGTAAAALAVSTGLSVRSVTELGYAAEQSGASVETVASAVESVNNGLLEAAAGSKSAAAGFEQLGFDVDNLSKLGAEDRFIALGVAIAKIEDPLDRAAAASKVFGTSNQSLIGMFSKGTAGINEMRQEAERLGLVMTGPQAASAKLLTEAYKAVQDSLTGLWRTLGAAVAPQLAATAQDMASVVKAVTAWVRQNQPLIAQVFKIASGVAAFGTGLAMLAGALPIILAVGSALGVGALAWDRYGASATTAINYVKGLVANVWAETTRVLGGIYDAVKGGDLELAVQVAWAGAQVAWIAGMNALAGITSGRMSGIFSALASGDWKSAIEQMWNGIQTVALDVVSAVDKAWTGLMNTMDGVVEYLKNAVKSAIDSMMSMLSKFDGVIAAIAKYDITGKLMEGRDAIAAAFAGKPSGPGDAMGAGAAAFGDPEGAARKGARTKALSEREAARQTQRDQLGFAQQVAADKATKDAAQRSSDASQTLQDLLDKAAAARQAAEIRPVADLMQRDKLAAAAAGTPTANGGFGATFSAAAMVAQQGGGSIQTQIANATKASAASLKALVESDKKRQQTAQAMQIMVTA